VFIIVLLVACSQDIKAPEEGGQCYKVTFELDWNATDFPTDYPPNPHFSRFVGWSHAPNSSFMATGTLASQGIKDMAEKGRVSPIDSEIKDFIANNEGYQLYIGEGLSYGVGQVELIVGVTSDYPCLSLVSMLAPSPDWFLGMVNVNLFDGQAFISYTTLWGMVYDAGTDSGSSFSSANYTTEPQQPIQLIRNPPLGDGTSVKSSICRIIIEKVDL